MQSKTQAAQLLDLVIEQSLDLSEYKEKLPALISQNFMVQRKVDCHKSNDVNAGYLVDEIIKWENGDQHGSLEATLIEKFHITGNYRRG
jgi:hypothetical protein